MIYVVISSSLCFCTIFLKKKSLLSKFFFILLTFVLAVRFGIGKDYTSYRDIYYSLTPSIINFKSISLEFLRLNIETGFGIIMKLFRLYNIKFETFIIFYSIVCMIFLGKVIKDNSEVPILSLSIYFLNYYIPYGITALRQFLAMILSLIAIIKLIKDSKYLAYLISIFLISLFFHISAIFLLLIPVLFKIKIFSYTNLKQPAIFFSYSIIAFFIGFLFLRKLVEFAFTFITKYAAYSVLVRNQNPNFLSFCVRLIFGFILIILLNKNKTEISHMNKKLCQIYFTGIILYMFFGTINISSRLTDYFSFLEILVFPNVIAEKRIKDKTFIVFVILILFFILYYHDIMELSYLVNFQSTSIFNYPYPTIFTKEKYLYILKNQK